MSLASESKRVAFGGELEGLLGVAQSLVQRLSTLKQQIADVRQRAAAAPEFTQTDLDEIDMLLVKARDAIQTAATSF